MDLRAIRVLYRAPDTMSLYGIPYEMRLGQSPKDLLSQYRASWVWLGSPGWWGDLTKEEQQEVTAFLAQHKGCIPEGPHEWSTIEGGQT